MGSGQSHDRYSSLDSSETSPTNNSLFSRLIYGSFSIWRKLLRFIPFLSTSEETQLDPVLPIRNRPSPNNLTKSPINSQPRTACNHFAQGYPSLSHGEEAKQSERVPTSLHDATRSFSSPGVKQETKKSFVIIQGIGSGKILHTSVREEVTKKKSSVFNHGDGKIPYTGAREEEYKKSFILNQGKGKIPYIGTRDETEKFSVLTQEINSGKTSYTSAREEAKKSTIFTWENSFPACGLKTKVLKKEVVGEGRWIKHYSSCHRILLVGEGDFSFSGCLAVTFGCASNMIATSLDSKEFLIKNYKYAPSNIKKLSNRNCRVLHGIDATEMAQHNFLGCLTFDRIIFNFPFAGFFKDLPRNVQIQRHKALVMKFLKNAKEMLSEDGEIHISHKSNDFHVEWNLECVAYEQGLRLIEAPKFSRSDYPGYHTKCGFGGDNDFNCDPSKTYKFGRKLTCMLFY